MAEGGIEEESGDMLGPAAVPTHQASQELNVKSEVSNNQISASISKSQLPNVRRQMN